MDLTLSYILSQIFVIGYYVIYSYTFHMKDSNKILIFGSIAISMMCISYIFLGAYTGVVTCIIAIFRNILFGKSKKNIFNLLLVLILLFIGFLLTCDSYFCLFNIISTSIYSYSVWQDDVKIYKFLGIFVNIFMIIYDIYLKSILSVILMFIAIISAIIGYINEVRKLKFINK